MNLSPTSTPAGTATSSVRRTINRWLSPDHAVGQSLMAARMRTQMALWHPRTQEDRELKAAIHRIAPAFTMVDLDRLRHLASCARLVVRTPIPGAIVECGTWRGGGLALIDWVLEQEGDRRTFWGFDSFAGLPPPGEQDGKVQRSFFTGWCAATQDDVGRAFRALGRDTDRVRLVEGWLADTLPAAETGPIAFLNIDVDWYESVKTALDVLVDRVVPGGVVNLDDYRRWPGCDRAIHEFLRERGLSQTLLQRPARHGAWFKKP